MFNCFVINCNLCVLYILHIYDVHIGIIVNKNLGAIWHIFCKVKFYESLTFRVLYF